MAFLYLDFDNGSIQSVQILKPLTQAPSNRDALLWSERLWTLPPTPPLYFSYKRNWISSTSPPLTPLTCRHKRILQPSNARDLIPTSERSPYLSSDRRQRTRMVSYSSRQRTPTYDDVMSSSPPSSSDYPRISSPPSSSDYPRIWSPPSSSDYPRISSPSSSSDYPRISSRKSRISTTTSYAMRMQSNFRLSMQKEAPMILFDQSGKMYTNFYPPIGHQSNENKQKADDMDWGRWYFPKWMTTGSNKT